MVIVEPGAFRTDWQGSSMTMAAVGFDYEATVGALHDFRRASQGSQPGDPVRAAQLLVALPDRERLPLRLPLGSAAVDMVIENDRARADEAAAWADVSLSADFPLPAASGAER
ncbi:hypothetical protein [Microbacterium jejuense]|uniref:hypothetical protein n=1 Tax=Microbacterium jejuense TaxID=1263637 RepID=UPI0031E5AB5F